MLAGVILLVATALSAPLPGVSVMNTTEGKAENFDLNDVNETNFVSKFISSLKTLMNYFNEHLPEGDLTNLNCEIVANKKERTFIFQDIEGKIYPNRIPSYSNNSGKNISARKYVEINFVDNEADTYGTVYLFPHKATNASNKVNNVFINVHIKNKQELDKMTISNITEITDNLKTLENINTNQTERSSVFPITTDQEGIFTNEGSTSILNFNIKNNNTHDNKNPDYGIYIGNTTDGHYTEVLNVNASLFDTSLSNMDRYNQFTMDYSSQMYRLTDNSQWHSEITEVNSSYADDIVTSPRYENANSFTSERVSKVNGSANSKLSSDPTSMKLQTNDNSQTILISDMPTVESSQTELYNIFNTINAGFSEINNQNQRNESNKEFNTTEGSYASISPGFHSKTPNNVVLILNNSVKNVSEEVITSDLEIISNVVHKKDSRTDEDIQNFDKRLTTEYDEFMTDYTTTAGDSGSAYSGLQTIIILNKTDEELYTALETTTVSPEFNSTYSTYFAGESLTAVEFSTVPTIIWDTSKSVILDNNTAIFSSNLDKFIINQNSMTAPNASRSIDEVTLKSLVTNNFIELKTNRTENPEPEGKMNTTKKAFKSLDDTRNTYYNTDGIVKSTPLNNAGLPSNYETFFTESTWSSDIKTDTSSELDIATINKSLHNDIYKFTLSNIKFNNNQHLKGIALPITTVTLSTTEADENNFTKHLRTNDVYSLQLNNESVTQTQDILSENTSSIKNYELFDKFNISVSTVIPNKFGATTMVLNNTDESENDSTSNSTNGSIIRNTQSLVSSSEAAKELSTSSSFSLDSYNSVISSQFTDKNFFGHTTDKNKKDYMFNGSSTIDNINLDDKNSKPGLKSTYPFSVTPLENEVYLYSETRNREGKALPAGKFSEEISTSNEFIKTTEVINLEGGSNMDLKVEKYSFGTDNRITVPTFSFTFTEPITKEMPSTGYTNDSTPNIGQNRIKHNGKTDFNDKKTTILVASSNNSEAGHQNENAVVREEVMHEISESKVTFSTNPYSPIFSQMSSTSVNKSDTINHKENKKHRNITDAAVLQYGTSTVKHENLGFNNFTFFLPTTEHLTAYVPLRLYTIKPISEIK